AALTDQVYVVVTARFCFRSLPITLTVIWVVCSIVYFNTSPSRNFQRRVSWPAALRRPLAITTTKHAAVKRHTENGAAPKHGRLSGFADSVRDILCSFRNWRQVKTDRQHSRRKRQNQRQSACSRAVLFTMIRGSWRCRRARACSNPWTLDLVVLEVGTYL